MLSRKLGIIIACLLCAVVAGSSELSTEKTFTSRVNDTAIEVSLTTTDWQAIPAIRSRVLSEQAHRHSGKFVKFTGIVETVLSKSPRGQRLETMPYHYDVYLEEGGILLRVNTFRLCEESDFISKDSPLQRGHRYEFYGFAVRYQAHLRYAKRGSDMLVIFPFSIRHLGVAE